MHRRIHHLSLAFLILASPTAAFSVDKLLTASGVQLESKPGLTTPREDSIPRQTTYTRLPVYFESNLGQFDPRVRFASRTRGVNVFLTDSDVVLMVNSGAVGKQRAARSVTMAAVNGNTAARITGLDELPGKVNYFYGSKPEHWHTDVPTYKSVKYVDVYPGIDFQFRGDGQQLEFDFVLAPGADPDRIVLAIKGADALRIDASGDAILGLGEDALRLRKPLIYQRVGAEIRDIPGSFSQDSDGNLGNRHRCRWQYLCGRQNNFE